jgi:hypothetical protein
MCFLGQYNEAKRLRTAAVSGILLFTGKCHTSRPSHPGIDLASHTGFPPSVIDYARNLAARLRDGQERLRASADVCLFASIFYHYFVIMTTFGTPPRIACVSASCLLLLLALRSLKTIFCAPPLIDTFQQYEKEYDAWAMSNEYQLA